MKKDLIVIGSYPSNELARNILKECILSLKDNFDIVVTTHYPVDEEIQKLVNYYIYDTNNEMLEYVNNPFVWVANETFYLQKKHLKNHAYAAYSAILNAVQLLHLDYEYFYYVNGDILLNELDMQKLFDLKKMTLDNNKKCLFFKPFDGMVEACLFFSSTKLFVQEIGSINTKQKFINYTKNFEYPYVPNVLESYLCKRIETDLRGDSFIFTKDIISYFNNSQTNRLSSFNGVPIDNVDYEVVLLKEKTSNRIFFVYWNYNSSFIQKNISVRIDQEEFTLINGHYSYWKEVVPTKDYIELEIDGTLILYSVKDILENKETYMEFK